MLKLIEKDKEIEKLRKGDHYDSKSAMSDDDNTSMSSKVSLPPNFQSMMNGEINVFNMMNDQSNIEYLRNIFGKYLVYMARKKRKKAEFCENILFNLLSLPEEQIKQINKARQKNLFWDWFKNFRQTGKIGLDTGDLDMNLNFTMTEVNDSIMHPHMYGGSIMGDDHLKVQKIETSATKTKKVVKKGKSNDFSNYNIDKNESEVKLNND